MELSDLRKPFDPSLVSWRVGAKSGDKKSAIALAYIDARDVMQRLDDVCGVSGWQCTYPHANGKTSCRIGIRIGDEWVWKENGSGDSQVEAEKGAFSDAFKRAAVLWGVGRYLYDVQNVWVDIVPAGRSHKIENPKDSKLTGALEKAAAGIRVVGETPPEKPPEVIWLENTRDEFRSYTSYDQLSTFGKRKSTLDMIANLSDAQMETYNKFFNITGERLAPQMAAE